MSSRKGVPKGPDLRLRLCAIVSEVARVNMVGFRPNVVLLPLFCPCPSGPGPAYNLGGTRKWPALLNPCHKRFLIR